MKEKDDKQDCEVIKAFKFHKQWEYKEIKTKCLFS